MLYLLQRKKGRGLFSAKLAKEIGAKVITPDKLDKVKQEDTVINCGVSGEREVDELLGEVNFINNPLAVAISLNKLTCLRRLDKNKVPVPKYSTDKEIALQWLSGGSKVYCRTLLKASKGNGIVVASTQEELVNAPLYTKRIPVYREYRCHVLPDGSYYLTRKRRRTSENLENLEMTLDPMVKNLGNGYIFSQELDDFDTTLSSSINSICDNAIKALGLNFGAVDIVTTRKGRLSVLEVNTSPALIGTTFEKYVEAFRKRIKKDE